MGEDGSSVRFYYGTRASFSTFELAHPNRLDKGCLGRGVYATSSTDLANAHAETIKRRGDAAPYVMPLFMAVKNAYVATLDTKLKLKNASQAKIDAFTDDRKAKGYDGVVLRFPEGHVELMAFNPTQVKSAIDNNGNFDGTNPDIRFSEQANEQTDTPKFKS